MPNLPIIEELKRTWIIDKMQEIVRTQTKYITGPTLYLHHWQCAVHAFTNANYDDAWQWVNKIQESPSNYRQDVQAFAKIMQLIIHYEQGNLQLLQYSIINTYRFLRKKKRMFLSAD